MSEQLDLELLLRVPYVEPDLGFDISPSGSKVAFSWNLSGNWEIYILDLNGNGDPKQVTTAEGAKFAPRWSPTGKELADVRDLDGGENYDIFVLNNCSGINNGIIFNKGMGADYCSCTNGNISSD